MASWRALAARFLTPRHQVLVQQGSRLCEEAALFQNMFGNLFQDVIDAALVGFVSFIMFQCDVVDRNMTENRRSFHER
jgi:hypothetical protein